MIKKWIIISLIILFLVANIHYAIHHGFLKKWYYSTTHQPEAEEIKQDKVACFLKELYNAGLRDSEEGSLAAEKATTEVLRQYALLMVKSKMVFKTRIEDLAKAKGVILPSKLNAKNAREIEAMKHLEGNAFNAKFIETLESNYKWDKEEIKKAKDIDDKDILELAGQYEAHIEKNQQIPKI